MVYFLYYITNKHFINKFFYILLILDFEYWYNKFLQIKYFPSKKAIFNIH